MNLIRLFGDSITGGSKNGVRVVCQRTFAAGKAKKGGKGSGANDAPKASTLSKEIKSSTVVGADPKILPESDYPERLWHLLDKQPALSELRRKNVEALPFEQFFQGQELSATQ